MRSYRINLLKKDEENLVNKVVYFALHYLRYIIVITQIVVIGVFFYRFKVDQDIIDLKENVSQKQEIFKITLPLIQEAQAVDQKSNNLKKVLATQKSFLTDLDYITARVPSGITLTRFEINDTTITLTGMCVDTTLVQVMTQKMNEDKMFQSVNVGRIEKVGDLFNFNITILR